MIAERVNLTFMICNSNSSSEIVEKRSPFFTGTPSIQGIDEKLKSSSEIEQLMAKADLIEWESGEGLLEIAIKGAEQELATIQLIMDELEPQRKYAHLPLLEAASASQREEWLLEFKRRTENYLLSIGTIPEDQLNAMRNHPDFEAEIVPHVKQIAHQISKTKDKMDLLTNNRSLLNG